MNYTRLHLGSGPKRLPTFLNVDIRPDVKPDIVASVTNLSLIRDNSVAEIYYCHGIEHLKYAEIPSAFLEWRRVLVSGGVLRLSMPNFAVLSWMVTQANVPVKMVRGAICGGQDYAANFHYSIWDFELVQEVLYKYGFSGVKEYDAARWLSGLFGGSLVDEGGKRKYQDWSILGIAGHQISLNVEARA